VSEPSELEARVRALEAAVEALSREVVTQRVAVVDGDGIARVVLSASLQTGSVLARAGGAAGETSGIELFASRVDGEPPSIGICGLADGDVVPLVDAAIGEEGEPSVSPVARSPGG
jgi:hypothetical protein